MIADDDKTLDDFFAKKDKSKKPKKTKKAKSDDAVQTLNDNKDKDQGEDWKDFEERKQKDYSNLKIQNLQIVEDNAKEEAEEQDANNESEDEDGVKKNSGEPTIWNVPTATSEPGQTEIQELPGTHNVVGGKYVPPSVKRSNMMMGQAAARRKPLTAPDIKSQAAFPTLSAANKDISVGNRSSDFEMVKKGTRSNDARLDNNKPRLDLENRYDSLRS